MKSGATVRAASYGMAALGAHCQLRPPERPSVSVAAALTRGGEIVAWRPSVRLMGRRTALNFCKRVEQGVQARPP
jgi:hypothetical protein